MIDELRKDFDKLEQEMNQCRAHYGDRIMKLEVGNAEKLTRLETQMKAVVEMMATFVTASRFRPVELIAFGLAGGVMTTALGLVLARAFGVIH